MLYWNMIQNAIDISNKNIRKQSTISSSAMTTVQLIGIHAFKIMPKPNKQTAARIIGVYEILETHGCQFL